jgi:hypothetical protein
MPDVFGVTVVTTLVCFLFLHARLRARQASGIPCALCLGERKILAKLGRHVLRERVGVCSYLLKGRVKTASMVAEERYQRYVDMRSYNLALSCRRFVVRRCYCPRMHRAIESPPQIFGMTS